MTVSHRTILSHRRVMAAAMASRSRHISGLWITLGLFAGLCLAILLGQIASFWLVQQLPFAWMFAIGVYVPTLVPAFFALVVVSLVGTFENGFLQRGYLSRLAKLGIPQEIDATFNIAPEGLRLSTERITIFPRWEAIDTVERGEDGWVISADHLHFLVPHDSFADEAQAHSFVAALVAKLPPEAKARSTAAVAFAAQAPAHNDGAELAAPAAAPAPGAVSGEISRTEVSWGAQHSYHRIAHPRRHAFTYPALAALVGGMLGLTLAGLLLALVPIQITLGNLTLFAGLTFLLPLLGAAAGLWFGYRSLTRIVEKAYAAGLSSRGTPSTAVCKWEAGPEGLTVSSARGSSTSAWTSIHEVFRVGEFWIVATDLSAVTIPRRVFADEQAERNFIAAVLARIQATARERSGEAAAFAA